MTEARRKSFAETMGIPFPIVQAPIGSASCPDLAASVSNAGGLGMLSMSWRSLSEVRACIRQTRTLTQKPFGVNFVLAREILEARPLQERLNVCLEERVALISLAWGRPAPALIAEIKRAGARVAYTVWDVAQALEAVQAGADILVPQGVEAGGHLNGGLKTSALVCALSTALPDTLILAAGGVATPSDVSQMLERGADGVWLGTRFVAALESKAHPLYKQKIIEAQTGEETVLTRNLYNLGWSDAPHRTIKNSTFHAWEAAGRPESPNKPGEGDVIAHFADGSPVTRYEEVIPLEGMTGDLEALAHYAGCSVERIHAVLSARQIVESLASPFRG